MEATRRPLPNIAAPSSNLILVSNRGPLSLTIDDEGRPASAPVAGGLATALGPTLIEHGGLWLSASMTDGERLAAQEHRAFRRGGLCAQFIEIDPETYNRYYTKVSNEILWPLMHGMLDPTANPSFETTWAADWAAYRSVNADFAVVIAAVADPGASVLVQDYHLFLVAGYLHLLRPDLQTVHFTHTPFCRPDELSALPAGIAGDLLLCMAAYGACGFHSARWETNFRECCAHYRVESPTTFVHPLGVHRGDLERHLDSPRSSAAEEQLAARVGDRALIVRVDRLDPAKNLVRGFEAYDLLLDEHPGLRDRVVLLSHAVPSREESHEMRRYRRDVERTVARINARWGSGGWSPIILDISNDRQRSLAALRRYDVLLVNSVRDGMNLVALEGALMNTNDGAIVLSRETGAWDVLSGPAVGIDPLDVTETAEALSVALRLSCDSRAVRARAAEHAASAVPAIGWLKALIGAADPLPAGAGEQGAGELNKIQ